MATLTETQLLNQAIFEQLMTPGMEKRAIDAVNDFTRYKMREDGFFRRFMPPLQISNDELDRQADTPKPVKIIDREPDSPAALSLPFGTLPVGLYIRGPRYRVMFERILSPRFMTDVDDLRTWVMDIRQVLSDNAVKDMLAEEDSKFIAAINIVLGGAANTVLVTSGIAQWTQIPGGITRESTCDMIKVMPQTLSHLEVETVLTNNVTIKEVMKWGRDEMGGDMAQDIIRNGWAEETFLGKRWLITIKRNLVPDNTMFCFGPPKFCGRAFTLEDVVMWIKREAFMLEFFMYETIGASIGNPNSLTRHDFI
jgi:hypothetical protein